jgi:hypothetical protein
LSVSVVVGKFDQVAQFKSVEEIVVGGVHGGDLSCEGGVYSRQGNAIGLEYRAVGVL